MLYDVSVLRILFIIVGIGCYFVVNFIIVWYLVELELRLVSGDDVNGIEILGKFIKDKIYVEELRLLEIMILVIKIKGRNRNMLC